MTFAVRSRTTARSAYTATRTSPPDAAVLPAVRGGGGGGRGGAAPANDTYGAGGSEDGYIATDPTNPDIYYAGGNNGSFLTRLNRHTGEQREVNPYPREFSGEESAILKERWQWTYPIVFSPVDPQDSLHRLAAPLEDDERWPELGSPQPRPHASRSEDDGCVRRSDHARHERPRGVRRHLRDRAVQAHDARHLDRLGRRH